MTPFVHLHLHTEFSLVDGIVRVKELVSAAKAAEMPAVAVTDLANFFAIVKFFRAATAAGIKPIMGSDVWIENPDDHNKPYRLVLLCQNTAGYHNLNRLISRAYAEGQHTGRPCISKDWLEGQTDGLIALSAAQEGDLGQALQAGNDAQVKILTEDYIRLFPNRFYIELQRTGQLHQDDYIHAAVKLAEQFQLPVVATNHVHFLKQDDFENHEARTCIHDGRVLADTRRPRRYSPQQYLRSPEEMVELFSDIPEAIENTVAIARRCNLQLEFGTYYLPDYPVPEGKTINDVLREQSLSGLEQRFVELQKSGEVLDKPEYFERLEMELKVIIDMGFPGYFLIVADFIQWAKHNDVPVGPGRGSGAGSLVAYALGITDLDPIKYELLFERFLNPERVSMPDFDVDFCMEKRDRVIDYVAQRYGRDKVSQIITYGTMAARAVVRDVGRVLDHPYGFVDKLAKLVPFEIGMTLTRALEVEPELKQRYDNEEEVKELVDTALSLEGMARNAGKHAGGVVIAPTPLTDFMPTYCEQGGKALVSQLDKDDLEAIGLVKFDFLGLRNLTIIDKAVKIINRNRQQAGEEPLVIDQLPIDDPASYQLLKDCKTTALFQLESRGMKDLIKRVQPDNFEEIVALVALFRPGPLQSGMVDDFINRKHGRAKVAYPHPSLEPILRPTYGIILYQEQVMQIAQVLSGYTLGGADLLRRAMGKKKPEEMAKQRDIFVSGAEANNVNGRLASDIFDLIEKFAGYGFNRSHSAAYALIAYQTAWLKAHYPAAFMAAVLSSDMDNTDKVVTMIAECRDMGLDIKPPAIKHCHFEFSPIDDDTILYGLGAIKGLGQAAIESILEERENKGPYKDMFELCRRVDTRKINRRTLESLIRAGALDEFGKDRSVLMASLNDALQAGGQHTQNQEAGFMDMFAIEDAHEQAPYVQVPDWDEDQRLEGEKITLGLYLTGHPINRYIPTLEKITDSTLANLNVTDRKSIIVAGLIVGIRTMQTKRGDRMAFITLDDKTGRIELAVFSDMFQEYRDLLIKDTLLVVKGEVSVDEYSGGFKMRANEIYSIDQAQQAFARRLALRLDASQFNNGLLPQLKEILRPDDEGQCAVVVHYTNNKAEADLVLGDWRIKLTHSTLEHLTELAGEDRVEVFYGQA